MDKLEQLRVFRKVVERGSLSRAAQDLGVTQPTVSKAVSKLEARVRSQLLLRSTRRLTVTDAGRRYYEHCRTILDSLDEAENELEDEDTPRGTLRLHGPVVLGEMFLGPIAIDFHRKYPRVRCHLTFLDTFVDLVAEGADVAIRLGALSDPSIVRRRLGQMERVFVAAPRYLRANGWPKLPEELSQHPNVRFTNLPMRDTVTAGDTRVDMRPGFIANNAVTLRDALVAGLGIGIVTRWLVANELECGDLVEVLPFERPPALEVNAVFPSARFIPIRARMFVDFLVDRLRGRPGMEIG